MMHTQTITRRTIKRVESRLNGLGMVGRIGRLGIPIPGIPTPPASTPPIQGTSSNGQILFSDFWNFLNGQIGELKIEATQFAEGMNRLFFGMEPGCTNPVPNIPVVPNNPTPRFCASSVAGMIERCRVTEARTGLASISQQFQQRMTNSADPTAPYITRWWNEYGQNNISNLTATIAAAGGTCGVTGEIPKVCTAPQTWCSSQLRCTYPGECSSSGISSTMVLGIAAVFALMLFMRR